MTGKGWGNRESFHVETRLGKEMAIGDVASSSFSRTFPIIVMQWWYCGLRLNLNETHAVQLHIYSPTLPLEEHPLFPRIIQTSSTYSNHKRHAYNEERPWKASSESGRTAA